MPNSSRCSVASSKGEQLPVVRPAEATSVVESLATLRFPSTSSTPLRLNVQPRLRHRAYVHLRSRGAV